MEQESFLKRTPRSVQRRILFLLCANLLLLGTIFLLLEEGASFQNMLRRASADLAPITLAGFALTGIIFTGAIDLSIASVIAFSGTCFGILAQMNVPPLLAFAGCMTPALLILSLNGILVTALKIPAIILTLGGLPFWRGAALILADTSLPNFSGNLSIHPESYHGPGKLYAPLLLLFGTILALVWEAYGKLPRLWLALGNSEEACRLMGLNPRRILRSAFCVGGLFLALAALVYVTRVQAIEPARIGLGFELQVIAAVIVGGTSIFGGEGTYLGTLLGACFLYLVSQVLVYAGISAYVQDAITGGLILLVIGMDCAMHRSRKMMEELT